MNEAILIEKRVTSQTGFHSRSTERSERLLRIGLSDLGYAY